MFVLSILKNTVEIYPNSFGRDFIATLVERINQQFANFVITDVGLCITFYDFKKIGDSFILPGNASTHTPVIFRYIVFQPLVNEILEGVISQSTREGITISMQFFSDINVAPDKLPAISKFDESVQIWSWEYQNEDKMTQFYINPGRKVRFKVLGVHYKNIEPMPGVHAEAAKPMIIEASMLDMGLGCIDWWNQTDSSEIKQEVNDNDAQEETNSRD